jgi:hypothetical protein
MYLYMKRLENEIFGTSLYEINRILDNWRLVDEEDLEILQYIKLAELV